MSSTLVQAKDIPALRREDAKRLATTEYERFGDLLKTLGSDDWSHPTDCERWTVKHIVSHVIAMATDMSSLSRAMRQQSAGKKFAKQEGLSAFDGWTELQARSHVDAQPPELVRRYRSIVPRALAVRGRRSPARLLRFPDPNYGWFSMAFLRDDILTRDVWMHRVDVSRAAGRDLVLTPEHDGRFVSNIVRDFAARWKQPFTLKLEGPAGGTFSNGAGGLDVRVDAVEFCRILSGRSEGHGLPTDVVPF
jgi:uncharacterized protein (TIGR03083 family)